MTYQRNETPEPLASTTTTEAFETGLRAEFEAWKRTQIDRDAWSAVLWATERAAKLEREDSKRLDWIIRQADEFSCTVIVDAPGDGDYIVHGMDGWGQGKTAREAIDNAMQFNAAAASIGSGKGSAS